MTEHLKKNEHNLSPLNLPFPSPPLPQAPEETPKILTAPLLDTDLYREKVTPLNTDLEPDEEST